MIYHDLTTCVSGLMVVNAVFMCFIASRKMKECSDLNAWKLSYIQLLNRYLPYRLKWWFIISTLLGVSFIFILSWAANR
jgi:hypothetical protein